METKTYKTIDREAAGWPSGEWDDEPDKVQWPDAATGLPCLAVRHSESGHWCGYVGVDERHPWHGKDYDEVNATAHGRLNFAGGCQPNGDEVSRICHDPVPGEPDGVWWFGFDCAHFYDHQPIDAPRFDASYKTLTYVQAECAELAAQIARAAAP